MPRYLDFHRALALAAIATASFLVLAPARAQTSGSAAATSTAAAVPSTTAAPRQPACAVTSEQARFDFPLQRTARLIASGQPVKIVALGSSSTYGAGASTSAAAYPSRLAEELANHFPGHEFTVLNRGVSGEEITDMLERLDTAVIAEQPDLVLWQVGTNAVLNAEKVASDAALPAEVSGA
jgi:acyl-CoA thioesterase-1